MKLINFMFPSITNGGDKAEITVEGYPKGLRITKLIWSRKDLGKRCGMTKIAKESYYTIWKEEISLKYETFDKIAEGIKDKINFETITYEYTQKPKKHTKKKKK